MNIYSSSTLHYFSGPSNMNNSEPATSTSNFFPAKTFICKELFLDEI